MPRPPPSHSSGQDPASESFVAATEPNKARHRALPHRLTADDVRNVAFITTRLQPGYHEPEGEHAREYLAVLAETNVSPRRTASCAPVSAGLTLCGVLRIERFSTPRPKPSARMGERPNGSEKPVEKSECSSTPAVPFYLHFSDLIVAGLRMRSIGFRSLKEALDTTTPGGRLVFHVFAALAEFIRELIIEGTNEGLAAAKARGQRLGRPPAMTPEQVEHARALLTQPDATIASIARLLGVSRSTIYKYVPELKTGGDYQAIEVPAPRAELTAGD